MNDKLKIMVVDDNKEFVKILTMFVNGEKDMEVVSTAYDGLNVVNLIKESNPDVILLDIIMPEKDGLAVLEESRPSIMIPFTDKSRICTVIFSPKLLTILRFKSTVSNIELS